MLAAKNILEGLWDNVESQPEGLWDNVESQPEGLDYVAPYME